MISGCFLRQRAGHQFDLTSADEKSENLRLSAVSLCIFMRWLVKLALAGGSMPTLF
jgi:hypothetical protein